MSASQEVEPGTVVHWLKSGIIYGTVVGTRISSEVSRRGGELLITEEMIEGTKDREGKSWLRYITDEDAQRAKWGEVVVAVGPAPAHLSPWGPGWTPENNAEADEEREKALARVASYPLDQQGEELAKVYKAVGRKSTVTTLQSYREQS